MHIKSKKQIYRVILNVGLKTLIKENWLWIYVVSDNAKRIG